MPGHVFVIHGDITMLRCDAWLLPCDYRANPGTDWRQAAPLPPGPLPTPRGWPDNLRAFPVPEVPPGSGSPRAWLVNVGGTEKREIGWFVQGATEFLDRAVPTTRTSPTRVLRQRTKLLLALPLVGTGRGGAANRPGPMVAALLPMLEQKAAEHDVDVVLVLNTRQAFAAALAVRRGRPHAFTELGDTLQEEAHRLAGLVNRRELVLFLGAGIGTDAGLPDWNGLLDELAEKAGLSPEHRNELGRLDPVDRAEIIARRRESTSYRPLKVVLRQSLRTREGSTPGIWAVSHCRTRSIQYVTGAV